MTTERISAQELVATLTQMHPAHGETIMRLAQGHPSLPEFAAGVRKTLGPAALLEALVAMRAGGKHVALSAKAVEHAQECTVPACAEPGCLQMRSMLQVVREHCASCEMPNDCATCRRWSHLNLKRGFACVVKDAARDEPKPCDGYETRSDSGYSSPLRTEQTEKPREPMPEAIPALMMLARSALGDITTSPVASRCNSPTRNAGTAPTSHKRAKHAEARSASPRSAASRAISDAHLACRKALGRAATPLRM